MQLPEEMMRSLYKMRRFCGGPPIIESVRLAVRAYIEDQEQKIGTTIEDASEAIERHERKAETNQDDWRTKLESRIGDKNRRMSRKLY